MDLRPALLALLLIAFSYGAHPQAQLSNREPATYTLADLFSHSDKVVLAKAIAGDATAYDIPLYKAQVVQAFKGATTGETIFFGRYAGVEIGSDYFLFLRNAPTPITPRSRTNAGFGPVTYSEVFDEGYSQMVTSYECIFPGTDPAQHCANAVRICADYILLPKSLSALPSPSASPSGCRWSLLATVPDKKRVTLLPRV